MKKIAVIGSTGSVGENTLRVIEAAPDRFQVVGLAAGRNRKRLSEQIEEHKPLLASLHSTGDADWARQKLNAPGTEIAGGEEGIAGKADEVFFAVIEGGGEEGVLLREGGVEERGIVRVDGEENAVVVEGFEGVVLDPVVDVQAEVAGGIDLERDVIFGEIIDQLGVFNGANAMPDAVCLKFADRVPDGLGTHGLASVGD